mmetsp:Transcript_178590/g.572484  ORF Transcript_178590/g.572484 Transcript_178590/m.572484 type:complete len:455 (-) Transcript_178590:250-1614(-)
MFTAMRFRTCPVAALGIDVRMQLFNGLDDLRVALAGGVRVRKEAARVHHLGTLGVHLEEALHDLEAALHACEMERQHAIRGRGLGGSVRVHLEQRVGDALPALLHGQMERQTALSRRLLGAIGIDMQQQRHYHLPARGDRRMQRQLAVRFFLGGLGVDLQEPLNDQDLPPLRRHMQGQSAMSGLLLGRLRVGLQKLVHDEIALRQMLCGDRHVQRQLPLRGLLPRALRVAAQEAPDDADMAAFGGQVQRQGTRLVLLAGSFRVSLQKGVHDLLPAALHGHVQGPAAIRHALFGTFRMCLQQQRHDRVVAVLNRELQGQPANRLHLSALRVYSQQLAHQSLGHGRSGRREVQGQGAEIVLLLRALRVDGQQVSDDCDVARLRRNVERQAAQRSSVRGALGVRGQQPRDHHIVAEERGQVQGHTARGIPGRGSLRECLEQQVYESFPPSLCRKMQR